MAKGVLGNDPFLRGAAVRAPAQATKPEPTPAPVESAAPPPSSAQPAEAKSVASPKKAVGNKKAASAKRPAAAPRPAEAKSTQVNAGPKKTEVSESVATPPTPLNGQSSEPRLESKPVVEAEARVEAPRAVVHSLVTRSLTQETGLQKFTHAAGGLLRAAQTALGLAGASELDSYGKDPALSEAIHPVMSFLYDRYWRVRTVGAEQLPSGPAVYVANHAGAIPVDGPILQQALARERPDLGDSRWLVEDQVFHAPFFGVLFNRLGAVRACPENALRLLSEGRPLLVFPEGLQGIQKPFRERYQLKRFGRGGFVKIALRAKVPIIPVAIAGSEETYPMLGKLPGKWMGLPYLPLTPLGLLPLPAKWNIHFGAPIHGNGADPEDFAHVAKLAEKTREDISNLLRQALVERKDPFRSVG
jgi:1-acyl-sn-glycerol-3-phosphate acyltransferase